MRRSSFCFVIGLVSLTFDSSVCGSNLRCFEELESNPLQKADVALLETTTTPSESQRSIESSWEHAPKNTKRNRESTIYTRVFSTGAVTVDVIRIQEIDKEILPEMKGLPISYDLDFTLFMRHRQEPEFLAKIYTALTHFTGASDSNFDRFKGSFSFQYMLDVKKGQNHSKYVYWLIQYRSFMRVSLYQLVPRTDPRRDEISTPTIKALFSKEDIDAFSSMFVTELLNDLEKKRHAPEEFVLSAPSNLLIFGYLDGRYFSKGFCDYAIFKEELKKLENRLNVNIMYPIHESRETTQKALTTKTDREIGFDEGMKTKAIEIARNLKSMKLTMEQIKKATGLCEEEIKAIK